MLLENKVAIIYGAGGAIGGAVTRAFAREGAKVFLAGRTLPALQKVADEISAAGGMAETAAFDAYDEQSVEQHAADVVAKAGGIDVTFNAIEIEGSIQGTPFVELSPEAISQPVGKRLATNFLTARAAARHMIKKRTGVILMITATPARMAFPLTGSFGIEGAAIEGLCRSLASELSPQGVRVICLRSAGSPESFPDVASAKTPLGKSNESIAAELAELTLLKRTPTLLEVGNVAAFMASDYASPMTATVANISCGTIVD
ncbi:MAG: SDR family oxidoreductase [Gloeobacteraceae cyanobacterium ES-bin-144]|nr:SDR family oxidoreductase [Verrucomicrobiales bacterium]